MEVNEYRFPWIYAVLSMVPPLLLLALELFSRLLTPQQAMAPMMVCSLLIGPSAAIVLAWGVYQLFIGKAKTYPALRWLVIMPVLSVIAGLALS